MRNKLERIWKEALHIREVTRLLIRLLRFPGCVKLESATMGRSGYTCVRHIFCTLNVLMWVSENFLFDSGGSLFYVRPNLKIHIM